MLYESVVWGKRRLWDTKSWVMYNIIATFFSNYHSSYAGLTKDGFDKYGFNMIGYDIEDCDYFFNGPFATIQSQRIWEILRIQDKSFLMTLPRTCEGLEPLPINWLQQYWITEIKDVTGTLLSLYFFPSYSVWVHIHVFFPFS